MKLMIHAEEVTLDEEVTVTELLKARSVKMPEMVSVELNGRILRRPWRGRLALAAVPFPDNRAEGGTPSVHKGKMPSLRLDDIPRI